MQLPVLQKYHVFILSPYSFHHIDHGENICTTNVAVFRTGLHEKMDCKTAMNVLSQEGGTEQREF